MTTHQTHGAAHDDPNAPATTHDPNAPAVAGPGDAAKVDPALAAAAALPAGFRVEPKKKVVLLKATIVDGKDAKIGDTVELDANVASILLGDGTAQTPEDAAKAKAANDEAKAKEGNDTAAAGDASKPPAAAGKPAAKPGEETHHESTPHRR